MGDVDRDNPVYEGKVPVKIERSSQDAVTTVLTVRILNGVKTDSHRQKQDLLHIELTEDSDTLFLYTLDVSEHDFPALKKEQSLLVDFKGFAAQFIDLLKCCSHKSGSTGSTNNFFALLSLLDRPVLSIIEANQFKHLTHLALNLNPGTDLSVKAYLAARLRQTLAHNGRIEGELAAAKDSLKDKTEKLNDLTVKFERAKLSAVTQEEKLQFTHRKELEEKIVALKEENARLLSQTQDSLSKQMSEQKILYENKIAALEDKLDKVSSKKEAFEKSSVTFESENKSLLCKVKSLTESDRFLTTEVERLRSEMRLKDESLAQLKTTDAENQVYLKSLRQQVADKGENAARTQQLLDSATERRKASEEKLIAYKQSTQKLQKKLEISINEINKGNEYIEKLQTQGKAYALKIKNKNIVIRQQEKYVEELKLEIKKIEQDVVALKTALKTEQSSVAQLKSSLDISQQKLEECNQLLESNQNVINYLNKELNKHGGGIRTGRVGGYLLGNGHKPSSTLFQFEHEASGHGFNLNSDDDVAFPRSPLDEIVDESIFDKDVEMKTDFNFESLPDPDQFNFEDS